MSFFRRNNRGTGEGIAFGSAEDSSTKTSVKLKLIESIKDLQIEYGEGNPSTPIESNELTHALVTAIEAIFVHGLKGQSSRPSRNARQLPAPNFWTFVLVFSHKETIHRIEKLSAVTTDIGRGRAWIRLAINDGLLGSYLGAMIKDNETLRRHYQRHAILRDIDLMDIYVRYLNGIEIYRFSLAINSGLLNRWVTGPLVLAGLVVSSNSFEPPTATAIDAASMLDENGLDPLASSTPAEASAAAFEVINRPAGYLYRGLLNEDEALRLILAGVSPANFSGGSSAVESPIGTPKGTPTPSSPLFTRKVQKRDKRGASQRPFPPRSQDPTSEVNVASSTTSSSKSDEMESAAADRSDKEALSVEEAVEKPAAESLAAVKASESFCEEDDENNPNDVSAEFIDIYARNSGHVSSEEEEEDIVDIYAGNTTPSETTEDSNKTDYKSIQDEEDSTSHDTFVTCPQGNNGASSLSSSLATESQTSQVYRPTTHIAKRPKTIMMSSSRSSGSGGSSCLTLAAVPYLAGFIDSWNPFGSGRYFDTPPNAPSDGEMYGFSLKPHVSVGTLSEEDSQQMMLLFDQVVREEGLDMQNYECAECTRAIGTIFGPAKICMYTKRYFCEECHHDETVLIPAKIMYNWDFRSFRVCHKAKLFLSAVIIEPIIDVKSFNGELFNFAPNLNEVFDLRKQLRYMNAYLATCADGKSQAQTTFKKMIWPRLYLFEEIDMYSIRDLEEIYSGKLISQLQSAVKFARGHILGCILCSGKGFICEVCREDQVIYPFDLDAIMQCAKCYTVFHLDCSVKITTCPKCDRIEARNLNWHVSLSRSQRTLVET
jgi:hypothetical protein